MLSNREIAALLRVMRAGEQGLDIKGEDYSVIGYLWARNLVSRDLEGLAIITNDGLITLRGTLSSIYKAGLSEQVLLDLEEAEDAFSPLKN
jgi:hypothetical protein